MEAPLMTPKSNDSHMVSCCCVSSVSKHFQTFKMSAQKRKSHAEGSGSSRSKRKPEITDALGIVSINPCYKPYSIRNWIGKDKKTKKIIVHKNEEKCPELLNFLLNMGNTNSFKVRTEEEAKEAVDMVFSRDLG